MGNKCPSLNKLTAFLGDQLIGVEIGVFKGDTSFGLLSSSNIKHLYMIDPWQSGYSIKRNRKRDSSDRDQEWMDATYQNVLRKSSQYLDRATVIRKPSVEAAIEVPDDLDFVFIDGNHSTQSVYDDLVTWVPKVKENGLVSGDDWSNGWKSVIKGVTRYIQEYDPFLPPGTNKIVRGKPVPYGAPIIDRTWQTVWWGIKKSS